jgi:hypothetical protein
MKELLQKYIDNVTVKHCLLVNDILNVEYFRESLFYLVICEHAGISNENTAKIESYLSALNPFELAELAAREPVWEPRGVRFSNFSIPAAGLSLLAMKNLAFLENTITSDVLTILSSHISKLSLAGGTVHDSDKEALKKNITLNTTAIANWITSNSSTIIPASQLKSGAFPYLFQSKLNQLLIFAPSIIKRVDLKLRGAYSPNYVDFVHHLMTLYFFMISGGEYTTASHGITFVLSNVDDGRLLFEFEPKLSSYKHTNLGDSSSYFYAALCLKEFRVRYQNDSYFEIESKLMSKIYGNLDDILSNPYIGLSEKSKKLAFPRAAETIWDKLFLLSLYEKE